MILYDGEYSWEGRIDRNERPISWWASNYHLKIVDLGRQVKGLFYLRPVIIKINDTGQGASVVNCLPEMAKHICAQFELDINRVLWVEEISDDAAGIQVAIFEKVATIAGEPLYKTDWRPATPPEVDFIRTQIG
jgi:hypothetical protein